MQSTRSVRNRWLGLGILGAAVAALVATACERTPLVAPSGTALTLVAGTNVLPVNGQTEISAILIEGGQGADQGTVAAGTGTPVHNGTVVTFSTTLGRLEPAEVKTTNGRATVRLIGDGRSGTATVTAFSGPATDSVEINVGAAAAAFLTLTAEPQTLPATGGTSKINARVEDVQGNPLQGMTVAFSTTKGTLSTTSAVTDAKGTASTNLTTTQEATVTGKTGGASAPLSETVTVALKPRTAVSLTPPASAIVAVPASFTITPGADAVLANVTIDFGDGTSASLGGISQATTISHPFRSPGVATVTATATDVEGGSGSVSTQVSVAPLQVVLTSTQAGSAVTFTATTSTGALIDHYEWDFGDGQTAVTQSNQVPHGYPRGSWVVTVRVVPINNGTPATAVTAVTTT